MLEGTFCLKHKELYLEIYKEIYLSIYIYIVYLGVKLIRAVKLTVIQKRNLSFTCIDMCIIYVMSFVAKFYLKLIQSIVAI